MTIRITLEDDVNGICDKDDYDNSRVFLGAKAPHRCRMPGEHVNSAYHDYAQVSILLVLFWMLLSLLFVCY